MHSTLRPFELLEPGTLKEAVQNLSSYGDKAKVLAGGLDLVSRMRRWQIKPEYLISIQKIPGLDYIEGDEKGGLKIGPLTSLRSLELSPVIQKNYTLLYEAVHIIASVQVKTMGTAVGNLCVATPASDVAAVLYVLGAQLKIAGPDSEEILPIEKFFVDVGRSVLKPGQIVTEIVIPPLPPGAGGAFFKLEKTRADIAKVNAAALITAANGICKEVRIALGSVAPTTIRASQAEALLRGKGVDAETIAAAAAAAADEANPITDIRSTAEYRKEMAAVLVRRALTKALERAETQPEGGAR